MTKADESNSDFRFRTGTQEVTVTLRPQDRGVVVFRDFDGNITTQPAEIGDSVLNIKRDLIPHITDQPMPTAWLTELRDYLTERIDARREAQVNGYLIQATADGRGFERVNVRRVEAEDVDDTSSAPRSIRSAGHAAAEAWYSRFRERGEQAEGYFFPSELREAFSALPAPERGHFLDGIGALMVLWLVSGVPNPGRIDTAEEIRLQALSPAEQDADCAEDEA
ncbi:hypothetical protein CAL26_23820 [Bordetella genomosp. 9]|uniref:Uncharacterized protein n=1 Tax=Bordetella genomosp. 9 TaxID=1416803 RepID=A0A261R669_9BORD|nr:hypothetical protein [Bordetella genomosp. 9]OZI20526.1 hypothetical protein CAL26_23820 [Bordetella genomosp. 9]